MSRTWMLRSGMVLATIVYAVTATHASPSREISVDQATLLDGRSIPPGNYTLGWEAKGTLDDVEITIRSGKRVVGRAQGRRVQLSSPSPYDAVIYTPAEGGAMNFIEIRFAETNTAIHVGASNLTSTAGGLAPR